MDDGTQQVRPAPSARRLGSHVDYADASLSSADPFQHNHAFDFRSRDGKHFAWGLTSEEHFPPGVEPKMHHNDFNVTLDAPKPWDLMTGKMQRWTEIDVPTGGGQTFVGFEIEALSYDTANGACDSFSTQGIADRRATCRRWLRRNPHAGPTQDSFRDAVRIRL